MGSIRSRYHHRTSASMQGAAALRPPRRSARMYSLAAARGALTVRLTGSTQPPETKMLRASVRHLSDTSTHAGREPPPGRTRIREEDATRVSFLLPALVAVGPHGTFVVVG